MNTQHAEPGHAALGVLVLFVLMAVTVASVLYLAGFFSAVEAPDGYEPAVLSSRPEPRATPYWRFREDWLTPRPRN